MERARQHDKVLVHYTGRLLDGRVFDTSKDRGAVELQLGDGSVLPGLEQVIVGMQLGETKSAFVKSSQAFGARREDLVFRLGAEQLPDEVEPKVGEVLTMQNDQGRTMPVQVAEVTPEEIVLDANHPLAGYDLTFDIELIRILAPGAMN